jgi:phosphate transport system substrate-binding protein
MRPTTTWTFLLAPLLPLALFACGGGGEEGTEEGALSGSIEIDGSSTVYPITEAIAEEFQRMYPDTRVTVGVSGTGGGFKRFCAGEIDISDASRPIKDEEAQECAANSITFREIRVAWDGLSIVTNPANDFVDCLTVDELKKIWEPGSTVNDWSQVRAGFPSKELALYGPGTDSGTFDYFTEEIVGEEDASRADYTASEDDNVLVQGIAGDPSALGYFGFAYYEENADQLRLLGVDGGQGCVQPSVETIESGTYAPLSRPLFLYVSDQALAKPQVAAFLDFALTEGAQLVRDVGYIALRPEQYDEERAKLEGAAAPSAPEAETTAPAADTTSAP